MKKKSPRGIPDFAGSRPKDAAKREVSAPSKPPRSSTRKSSPTPQIKPQSTSGKSGQRGQ